MKDSTGHPLKAELVEPGVGSQARLAAVLLAAAPLLARLGWWWLRRGRDRVGSARGSDPAAATQVVRTEIEVLQRWPGRRQVRMVKTSWLVSAAPPLPAPVVATSRPRRWVGPALRLLELALQRRSGPELAESRVPRLASPSAPDAR